ncbi:Transporter of the ATP-binding cassette (ABC) [Ciborinia camelliae]|nr:Transporter of the ATP-binding cassette (ABC) [Ciborinia camelliae]
MLSAIAVGRREGVSMTQKGKDRRVSGIQSASALGLLSFAWLDPMLREGYRGTLEAYHIPKLEFKDRGAEVINVADGLRSTGSFVGLLWRFSRTRLLLQTIWGIIYAVNTFIPTLLLKAILQYFESPSSKSSPWLFAILLFVSGIVSAVAGSQPLWIGRKLCINLRTLIVAEIYQKALRRQTATSHEDDSDIENKKTSPTVGKIINLMSVDSVKISEAGAYLFSLWAETPVQISVAVILLFSILGVSSLTGVIIMILLMPVNAFIAQKLTNTQQKIMSATDERIQATNELLQSIRLVKLFAWDIQMRKNVEVKRRLELKMLRSRFLIWSLFSLLTRATPLIITFTTFLAYAKFQKKALTPSVTFPALSLFGILQAPLNQITSLVARFQAFKVSLVRVQEFLLEPETEKYEVLGGYSRESRHELGFKNATMTWTVSSSKYSDQEPIVDNGHVTDSMQPGNIPFRLTDINLKFQAGKLNVIVGPTGSGKTSLLLALLGEMSLLHGRIRLPNDGSPWNTTPGSSFQIKNKIAYCAQQAWLLNDTVKQNILFASPWDEDRYRQVISCCALETDFAIFDRGDSTLVGEKGAALSGGQKQRISLARALYSNAAHLILDDCLSALDSKTAQWIYKHGIRGRLMQGRTCILATHNLALCIPGADFVVAMEMGRVVQQGPSSDFLKTNPFIASAGHSPSSISDLPKQQESNHTRVHRELEASSFQSQTIEESKREGVVAVKTIRMYLKAMGGRAVASNIWVREWSNSERSTATTSINNGRDSVSITPLSIQPSMNEDQKLKYYLGIYALIGIAYLIISLARDIVQFGGSLKASGNLHKQLIESVTKAKFSFFDKTPMGQIVNRFSTDIELLDQELAPVAVQTLDCVTSIATTIIMISIFTPYFLVAVALVFSIYLYIGKYFLRTSRDLKRIEAVTKSPLYQHFGETLNGLTTIRAYQSEKIFINENLDRIDNNNGPYFYLWAANRWLAFRLDAMGAFVTFCAAAFIISSHGRIDAGAAGLSLLYAVTFTENVVYLVRLQANNEQNLNSMERIEEYIQLDREGNTNSQEFKPPLSWPSKGAIEFVNFSTRYNLSLAPVLHQINLKILPQQKIGVVGRTGAGKSSLAMALFRALEADEGQILIDGIDIGSVDLTTLRQRISIVPQEAVLFSGTIRMNLDPMNEFSDSHILDTLSQLGLTGSQASNSVDTFSVDSSTSSNSADRTREQFSNLSFSISEGGGNISQGQRQLLCLARALLKGSKLILMDEATGSVDHDTEKRVREAIRDIDSTMIVIAHRLRAIFDYDVVVVLDKGRIIETGSPKELVHSKKGAFWEICKESGDAEILAMVET